MTPPTLTLACPEFSTLSPTKLIALLAKKHAVSLASSSNSSLNSSLNKKYHSKPEAHLVPVWLNNDGQNVIGILPKCQFIVAPTATSQTDIPKNTTQSEQLLAHNSIHIEQIQRIESFPFCYHSTDKHLNNIQKLLEYLIQYQNREQYQSQNQQQSNATIAKHGIKYSTPDKNRPTHYNDGFIGFISYDLMASELANKGEFHKEYFNQYNPTTYFGHYDIYLTCQTIQTGYQWQLHCTSTDTQADIQEIYHWLITAIENDCDELSPNIEQKADSLSKFSLTKPSLSKASLPKPAESDLSLSKLDLPKLVLTASWSKSDYQTAFDRVQNYLYAGDCYQINLTQQWQGQLQDNHKLVEYLPILDQHSQAPFAGYLAVQNFELLSCSPELFFTFSKNNQDINIITKPIKGTRPRGKTPQEDEQLKSELANSKKDLAENVMIVDLLRNDLGKYAQIGTVKVPKRFAIESFSNVHHMVSTITATIKTDTHPLAVLFGSLPAGSITGTPKKRAVEIIQELEGEARGAYCGTMGFMNFDGTGQWNVLIRTLQADKNGKVSLWAGGGVTVGSECDAEYQECLDKVGFILEGLKSSK